MARHAAFLNSSTTQAWLSQIDPRDQSAAIELLESLDLVSRDTFSERLRKLILERLHSQTGPVGLYVERELGKQNGVPDPLFAESGTEVRRAYGDGPQAVQPTRQHDPSVGSEGIVAQLASELCREFPALCIDHPGPDKIRKKRIRRFFLLTDFLGTGRRARTYLQAAWRVRSVRSWWSARASKGMSFEVMAYSATAQGQAYVRSHPCAPTVSIVAACPTISAMPDTKRERLETLCCRYDPLQGRYGEALGYGGIGALVAFAHGVPNNAPRILYKRTPEWAPLFPKRVTSSTRDAFDEDDLETIRARLLDMRQTRLATAPWLSRVKPQSRAMLVVLAALSRPIRDEEVLSRKTGLTIVEVRRVIATALAHDWITDHWRLSAAGQAELANARNPGKAMLTLPEDPKQFYYPTSLRVPAGVSS